MAAPDALKAESEAFRKELLDLGERLSALRHFRYREQERKRRKLTAYEAKLDRLDRTLDG